MVEFPLLPSGEPLPLAYRWLRAHGVASLTPWHFYDDAAFVATWRDDYQKETGKDAWPFAHRQDRMEIAAFPLRCGKTNGKVIILDDDVFDKWGDGPRRPMETFQSFTEWFLSALHESTEQWMTEQELADLLAE